MTAVVISVRLTTISPRRRDSCGSSGSAPSRRIDIARTRAARLRATKRARSERPRPRGFAKSRYVGGEMSSSPITGGIDGLRTCVTTRAARRLGHLDRRSERGPRARHPVGDDEGRGSLPSELLQIVEGLWRPRSRRRAARWQAGSAGRSGWGTAVSSCRDDSTKRTPNRLLSGSCRGAATAGKGVVHDGSLEEGRHPSHRDAHGATEARRTASRPTGQRHQAGARRDVTEDPAALAKVA
jgi:hypothetical protein